MWNQKRYCKKAVIDAGEVIESLEERIVGRYLAEELKNPDDDSLIASAGDFIDEDLVSKIVSAEIDAVKVRSPLTCALSTGMCATCYGRDLARGTKVNMGEAVGVVSRTVIGEPGTQLTMRTFHIGADSKLVQNHLD